MNNIQVKHFSSEDTVAVLSFEIIKRAIHDLEEKDKSIALSAFNFLNSKDCLIFCDLVGVEYEYLLNKYLLLNENYTKLSLNVKKSRHLVGAKGNPFKKTMDKILKDFNQLKEIAKN